MLNLELARKNFIKKLEEEGKSSSTIIAYNKDIEQLCDYLKNNDVEDVEKIKLEKLEGFMENLASQDYTPKSISRKTNATRTFIKYLFEKGDISKNMGSMLKHPTLENKAPRILSKMEYRALRDATREDPRTYTMVEVLLQTGLTISELAELKLENIQLEKESGNLFVPKKNNKDARNIPLNKAVIESVKKYMESERPQIEGAEYLFITKTGNHLLVRNIRSTIDRYFKLAEVKNARIHDLRHTFIANHLANGVSILHLSKIAGHKRISTTEKYLQYIDKPDDSKKTELDVL